MRREKIFSLILFFVLLVLSETGFAQNKILDIHTKDGKSYIDVRAGRYENDTLYFFSETDTIGVEQNAIKLIRYKRKGFALTGFITGFLAGAGLAASTVEEGEALPNPIPGAATTCVGGFFGGVIGGITGAIFGIDSKYDIENYAPEKKRELLEELVG